MPVLVVGADTTFGRLAIDALSQRAGELRAFVSDPDAAAALRARGVKVALGDVSDGSHVGSAGLRAFGAVLVCDAALDGRERSFARSADEVYAAWAAGLREAGVTRAIWLEPSRGAVPPDVAASAAPESVVVPTRDEPREEIAAAIARLDAAESLEVTLDPPA